MKLRLTALCCAVLLVLTGCSSMLNREYASSSVHVEYPVNEDSSILQAENYQGLVNAILYFVTEHDDSGVIHLSNYTGDVAADLDAACTEVCTEDPLGAYAIETLAHSYTRIVTYYEVTISVEYAHTAEEIQSIKAVTGSTAIRQAVSSAMASFSDRCLLRISYFTGDDSSLTTLARQTYFDTPLAALAMPDIQVTLYPNSGTSRIAELTFVWPESIDALNGKVHALEQQALQCMEALGENPDALTISDLLTALKNAAVYDPNGGSTAYAALVEGAANDQGFALALRLLCQLADLEATVVEGSLAGQPRFWLIVSTAEGYRHLDPALENPAFATDAAFRAAGYVWEEGGRYPDCTDYSAVQSEEFEITY